MTAQRRSRNGYRRKQQQQKQVAVVPQQSTSEEDSTDSGSVTRCVCGESHNVGLMIQCDQCEVWQHCDCVGLMVPEEMPDQYYCEECKPQNHAIVKSAHGSRTKRSYSSIGRPNTMSPQVEKKAPKKRMTFNSREASMSLEDVLAARNALETNLPPLNESSAPSSPIKETEEDNNEENEQPLSSQQQKSKSVKKERGEKESSGSPSQQSKQQRQQNKKSPPMIATLQESDDMDVDLKEQDMETADSEADTVMTGITSTSTVAVTRPAKPKRGGSGSRKSTADSNDVGNGSGVTNGRVTKTEKRPRGGGVRRANTTGTRRAQSSRPRSRTSTPQPSDTNAGNNSGPSGNNNSGGGNGTNNGEGLASREMDISTVIFEKLSPAAREASPPAKVRMPSSRMTISEMNRRAKQILEYISSIQVEMATREPISCAQRVTTDALTVDVNTTTFLKMSDNSTSPTSTRSSGAETNNSNRKINQLNRSPKPTAITIPEKNQDDDDAPSSSLSSASTIPLDASEVEQRNAELKNDQEKGAAEEAIAKAKSEQSSMEIMDTLTRELIRFQRRFGSTHDSGRGFRQSSRYYHRDMTHDAGSGSEGEGRVTRSREASASSSASNFLYEKRAAHI